MQNCSILSVYILAFYVLYSYLQKVFLIVSVTFIFVQPLRTQLRAIQPRTFKFTNPRAAAFSALPLIKSCYEKLYQAFLYLRKPFSNLVRFSIMAILSIVKKVFVASIINISNQNSIKSLKLHQSNIFFSSIVPFIFIKQL